MSEDRQERFREAQTLWESHLQRGFPSEARGVDADDLVLLDANTAGHITTALGSRGAKRTPLASRLTRVHHGTAFGGGG
jgi:hypothetical protein